MGHRNLRKPFRLKREREGRVQASRKASNSLVLELERRVAALELRAAIERELAAHAMASQHFGRRRNRDDALIMVGQHIGLFKFESDQSDLGAAAASSMNLKASITVQPSHQESALTETEPAHGVASPSKPGRAFFAGIARFLRRLLYREKHR